MDVATRQREAESLVHMNFAVAYKRAIAAQATTNSPQENKERAAAMLATSAATNNRDSATISMREANTGRAALERSYGERARDVSAILSGRVADYDFPKSAGGGTNDLAAMVAKTKYLAEQVTAANYATRGRVSQVGPSGNFMEAVNGRGNEMKAELVSQMLHTKAAINGAVDRKEFDKHQGEQLYERYQKASFDTGSRGRMNQQYSDFAKSTMPQMQDELSREVEKRYAAQASTIERARKNEIDPQSASRASAFKTLAQDEAMKKHPELAGAYAVKAAMIAAATEGKVLNPKSVAVVQEAVSNRIVANLENGRIPEIKQKIEVQRDRDLVR